jgi:phosphatidylserine/phosphatidylglycerophosphate/cardiolipin synthase-like enzyme
LFAYDLNEPDFAKVILQLAAQGRARVILDNAALHHNKDHTKMEDKFEDEFNRVKTGNAEVKRGKFGRYAHDKVIIILNTEGPTKVLTGSTNFAVTGFYVNSNHVLVFNDPTIAAVYHDVFEQSWIGNVKAQAFRATTFAQQPFSISPSLSITFSPHEQSYADKILENIATRIAQEENQPNGGCVLFAVMQMDNSESTVYKKLKDLHENSSVISYGISDAPGGIILHEPSKKHGILVSGKPGKTVLPAPFNQVPGISGHQIHHKFVVCGFNRPDAVVYCGSSNLANGGENKNGDNLLAFYDSEVATVFAIEAIALVDHFQFLDRCTREGDKNKDRTAAGLQAAEDPASSDAAVAAHWYLSTTDYWVKKYYDPGDLYCSDRLLFGQ